MKLGSLARPSSRGLGLKKGLVDEFVIHVPQVLQVMWLQKSITIQRKTRLVRSTTALEIFRSGQSIPRILETIIQGHRPSHPGGLQISTENVEKVESQKSKQRRLNDLKYDLMVLNQDLSKVVPSSKLSEDLMTSRSALQEKINKLEAELNGPDPSIPPTQTDVKKVKNEDGQVRIWSSS